MAVRPPSAPDWGQHPEADILTISPEDLLKFTSSLDSDTSGDSKHPLAKRQNALMEEEFGAAVQALCEERPDLFDADSSLKQGEFLTYPRRPQRNRQREAVAPDELAENNADGPRGNLSLAHLDSYGLEDSVCPPSKRVNAMNEGELENTVQRLRDMHPDCFDAGRPQMNNERVNAMSEEEWEAAVQRLRETHPDYFDTGRPLRNGNSKAATPNVSNNDNEKFCLAHIFDFPPALDSSDSEDDDAPPAQRANAEDLQDVVDELHKRNPDLFHSTRQLDKPRVAFPRRPAGKPPPRRPLRTLKVRHSPAVAPKAMPYSPRDIEASGHGSTDFVSVEGSDVLFE